MMSALPNLLQYSRLLQTTGGDLELGHRAQHSINLVAVTFSILRSLDRLHTAAAAAAAAQY